MSEGCVWVIGEGRGGGVDHSDHDNLGVLREREGSDVGVGNVVKTHRRYICLRIFRVHVCFIAIFSGYACRQKCGFVALWLRGALGAQNGDVKRACRWYTRVQ